MRESWEKRMGLDPPRRFQSSIWVDRQLWDPLRRDAKWADVSVGQFVMILAYRWLRARGEVDEDFWWEQDSTGLEGKIEQGYHLDVNLCRCERNEAYEKILERLKNEMRSKGSKARTGP